MQTRFGCKPDLENPDTQLCTEIVNRNKYEILEDYSQTQSYALSYVLP